MIAIEVSSSMSVKPDALLRVECFFMTIHNYWFQTMVIALDVLVNTSSEVFIINEGKQSHWESNSPFRKLRYKFLLDELKRN